MVLPVNYLHWLAGTTLAITALMTFASKNYPCHQTTGLFQAIFAVAFPVGDKIPPIVVGAGVVIIVLLTGISGATLGKHDELPVGERRALARRLGNRLFIPTLTVPLVIVVGSVFLKGVEIDGDLLLNPKSQTFVSLGLNCVISLALVYWLTRNMPMQTMHEPCRLVESSGQALVLPQMLAILGPAFADAGVGETVAYLTTAYVSMDYRLVVVVIYCVGTTLFAAIMGNGLVVLPVMTGGVGVPVLVDVFHTNPAVTAATGMFSDYRDTLMTPMAVGLSIVSVALLELFDKNAMIKARVPTALLLLTVNIVFLYFLMLH